MCVAVPLHHELVGPAQEIEVVGLEEVFGHILAEGEACAAGGGPEPADLVGVRPEEVCHGALVRDLAGPVQVLHLVYHLEAGGEAAVHAEYFVVDGGRQGEEVEEVGEGPPHARVPELADDLVVEAVDLRDLPALVVPAQQVDVLGVHDLERQQEEHGFHRVQPPIHEVAHEEVVAVRGHAPDLE